MTELYFALEEIDMMKHAWGWSEKKPGYRTHYCVNLTDPRMNRLVNLGMFKLTSKEGMGEGMGIFHLTDQGIDFLKRLKA